MESAKLSTFECLGLELDKSGDQAIGECPFCYKQNHFYVNPDTGQWDCKSCGEQGNVFTFLEKMIGQAQANTTDEDYGRLAKMRGIPAEEFRKAGLGWNGEQWWLPGLSPKGSVHDIRRWWQNDRLMSTTGCQVQLWGVEQLAAAPAGTVVWVCEGEWDGIAMRWLVNLAELTDIVVAVPGASIFKKDWLQFFVGKTAYICYDNDQAGDDGSEKAGQLLKGVAKETKYLCWPEIRPRGYDVRDFVKEGRGKSITADEGIDLLEKMLSSIHRRAAAERKLAAKMSKLPGKKETPISFRDVQQIFSKWVRMDQDMTDALSVCLATAMSTSIEGDPLWFYIIGPPGGGKSLLLMSMSSSPDCLFRSSLTPASLVSGFKMEKDPSLLPEMNGKTAIFKDGTELLAMQIESRKEAYGVLRGAFDGHVTKSFGNGVKRDYQGLHFSMLIGMTPAVHGDNQATMGERFLKFEMKENVDVVESKILAAITNISKELKMQEELSDAVRKFLLRKIDPDTLPEIPTWVIDRVVAIAQLLSMLRANVERENFGDRDLRYRPTHEVGTRIAKQLVKLGQCLTYVLETGQINEDVYGIMYRVAMNTSIGFHFDITKTIVMNGNEGMTKEEISRTTGIPKTTLDKRLADLEQLNVVKSRMVTSVGPVRNGPAPKRYSVTERVASLWERASGTAIPTKESLADVLNQFSGPQRSGGQRPRTA